MGEKANFSSERSNSITEYIRSTPFELSAELPPETTITQDYVDEIIDEVLPFDTMVNAAVQAGMNPQDAPRFLKGQFRRYKNLGVEFHAKAQKWIIGEGIERGEMFEDDTYAEPGCNMFLHLAFTEKKNQPIKATGADFARPLVAAGRVAIPELQAQDYIRTPQVDFIDRSLNSFKEKVDRQGQILFTQYVPPELILAGAMSQARAMYSVDIFHGAMKQSQQERGTSKIAYKAKTLDGREVSTSVGLEKKGSPTEVVKGIFTQQADIIYNPNVYNDQNIRLEITPYDNHSTTLMYYERNGEAIYVPWAVIPKNITEEQYEHWLALLRIIRDVFENRATATKDRKVQEVWNGNNQSLLADLGHEKGLKGRARLTFPTLKSAVIRGIGAYFTPQIAEMSAMGLIEDIGQGKLYENAGSFFRHNGQYLQDGGEEQADEEVTFISPLLGMVVFPNLAA